MCLIPLRQAEGLVKESLALVLFAFK